MAYTKTLIGDITEKGVYNPSTVITQGVAAICDTNFTAIEQTLTDIAVEATSDAVGAMVTGNTETGITVTYQDGDNTLDFVVDSEWVADTVGAMFTSNTETGITATYQDEDNTIDLEVSAEFIADTIGAMVTSNTETGIAVTYDDADNTLDFVLGAHAHTAGDGDGGALTGYQATPFASTLTLTQMGIVPPVAPNAWAGTAMAALTGASTFQQLLDAISTDIATAGT